MEVRSGDAVDAAYFRGDENATAVGERRTNTTRLANKRALFSNIFKLLIGKNMGSFKDNLSS